MQLRMLCVLALVFSVGGVGSLRAETLLQLNMREQADEALKRNIANFAREVESRTAGAVKIGIVNAGGAAPAAPADMEVVPLSQYAGNSPAANIFFQPFLFNFDAIVRAAAEPGSDIRRAADADILKLSGARPLWWQAAGWNVIFAKGSLSNPDALSNRKVRVEDNMAAQFVELCGGTPQLLPDAKQIEALNANQVDASVGSISEIKGYELWRMTDTITNVRHSKHILVVAINAGAWAKLTPDQQMIIATTAMKTEKESWEKGAAMQAELYAFAESKGMKIANLSPDDTVAWRICSSAILESFMDRSGAAGARLLAAYGKLRAHPAVLAARP